MVRSYITSPSIMNMTVYSSSLQTTDVIYNWECLLSDLVSFIVFVVQVIT